MATQEESLRIYTVYRHPLDFPNKWVIRAWNVIAGSAEPVADQDPIVCDSLDEARERLPPGLVNIGRRSDDDWAVHEVWI